MHGERPAEHLAYAMPPAAPEPLSTGEWAIGIGFVLAAVAVVALIALALARLPA